MFLFFLFVVPAEDRRDEEALYHPMKLSQLQEKAPFINWTDHFSDALKIVNRSITSNEQVVVYAPEFLKNLSDIIKKYQETAEGKM